jgi:hypothetical protein
MSRKRVLVLLGFAAVLVTVVMSSCFPPVESAPSAERWKSTFMLKPGFPPPRLTPFADHWKSIGERIVKYTVVDECGLVDASGANVDKIVVEPSTPILWVNEARLPAVIEFSSYDIVGRDAILLNPGESCITTTRSTMVSGTEYRIRVRCKGEEVIDGPTPPIEQEEPKP